MIDDDELDRILENTILDKFELHVTDLPRELLDSSLQKEPGTGSAPIMDTNSTPGMAPRKGNNTELRLGLTLARGLLGLPARLMLMNLIICGIYFIQLLV